MGRRNEGRLKDDGAAGEGEASKGRTRKRRIQEEKKGYGDDDGARESRRGGRGR